MTQPTFDLKLALPAREPEVHLNLLNPVTEERRITVEILRLLRNVEREMIYADLGYPSLFAYCTKGLGYSESAAYRRIDSMRAIKEEPQLEQKIATGELSLSTVSTTRSTIRAHERAIGFRLPLELKSEIMSAVTNQSKRNAEQTTVQLIQSFQNIDRLRAEGIQDYERQGGVSPVAHTQDTIAVCRTPVSLNPITERRLPSGLVRVTMEFTADEMKVIEDLRQLKSRTANTKDLFISLARKELHLLQRKLGDAPLIRQRKTKSPPLAKKISGRVIPTYVRRASWQRARGHCEFVSPITGKRCTATHALEFDHKVPFAKGGSSNLENIRVLCRNHNVRAAVDEFGHYKTARFVPSLS